MSSGVEAWLSNASREARCGRHARAMPCGRCSIKGSEPHRPSPAAAAESLLLVDGPRAPWLPWAALAAARARRRRSACRASCWRQERMPGSNASSSWKRPHCGSGEKSVIMG